MNRLSRTIRRLLRWLDRVLPAHNRGRRGKRGGLTTVTVELTDTDLRELADMLTVTNFQMPMRLDRADHGVPFDAPECELCGAPLPPHPMPLSGLCATCENTDPRE